MVDTQKSLITYIYNLLTTDPDLKEAMGNTVRLFYTWANSDAVFPYLVHRMGIRRDEGCYPIQRATYYLDIWSDSDNANEILAIRKRLIELLDELVFNTDDVSLVHIEYFSGEDSPEPEEGIWHYVTLWDLIFRRDAEANYIEGR